MLTILISICFGLTTISHAELNNSTTPSPSPFDMKKELAKISKSCFTVRDYELLTGDNSRDFPARLFSMKLFPKSSLSIGLAELRRSLNFGPLRPWKPYNSTRPSEEELASAPSIEEYYNMIEPIPSELSLDDRFHFEKNVATAIEYLDKRLPSIRKIYRHRFEKLHQLNHGLINRQSIDRMTNELKNIKSEIGREIGSIIFSSNCKDNILSLYDKN